MTENDTRSDEMKIFDINLAKMRNFATYTDLRALMVVHSAGGQEEHLLGLVLEARFIDPTTIEPWGAWFDEIAVIRRVKPNRCDFPGGKCEDIFSSLCRGATGMLRWTRARTQ